MAEALKLQFPFALLLLSMHACMLNYFSPVWFFVTLWTVAHQAPLSMGFSRQESGILKWIAMPSSKGSFQYRDPAHISNVSCNGMQVFFFFFFFTTNAPWEAPHELKYKC